MQLQLETRNGIGLLPLQPSHIGCQLLDALPLTARHVSALAVRFKKKRSELLRLLYRAAQSNFLRCRIALKLLHVAPQRLESTFSTSPFFCLTSPTSRCLSSNADFHFSEESSYAALSRAAPPLLSPLFRLLQRVLCQVKLTKRLLQLFAKSFQPRSLQPQCIIWLDFIDCSLKLSFSLRSLHHRALLAVIAHLPSLSSAADAVDPQTSLDSEKLTEKMQAAGETTTKTSEKMRQGACVVCEESA